MAPIARRTRSRGKGSSLASPERPCHFGGGQDGGASAGCRRARARDRASVDPPGDVIVIDEDGGDEDGDPFPAASRGEGGGICKAKRRRRSRRPVPEAASVAKGGSDSDPSLDRRAVIFSSDSDCTGSEDTVELHAVLESASVREESASVEELASRDSSGSVEGEALLLDSDSDSEAEDEGLDAGGGEAPSFNGDRGKKAALRHGDSGFGSCVAGRTRLQRGEQTNVSYNSYFLKEVLDDSEVESEEEAEDESSSLEEEKKDVDGDDEKEEEEEEKTDVADGANDISLESENGETDDSEMTLIGKAQPIGEKDENPDVLPKKRKLGIDIPMSPSSGREKNCSEEITVTGRGEVDAEKYENSGTLLKKRKLGIDILVSPSCSKDKSNNEGHISTGSTGVAQRTRSHNNFMPNKKMKKFGTIRSPYPVDEDVWESESDSGLSSPGAADEEEEAIGGRDKTNVDEREEEMVQKELCKGEYKKRKRVQAPRGKSLYKFLLDMILNDHPEMLEELISSREKSPQDVASSQNANGPRLIFAFSDDEETEPVEKSEHEKAIDELWTDFEFAKEALNIGTCQVDEGQEDIIFEADPSTLCSKGEHQIFLDEQIGNICKVCSVVVQEIRDILSCRSPQSQKQSVKKSSTCEKSCSVLDDLCTTIEDEGIKGSRDLIAETAWDLVPGIYETMYEHQREAFEFMWENLVGGIQLDQSKSCAKADGVGGCVISHAPGTGKTRLAIVFIQSYMTFFPQCRPVIIAPSGMLLTWEKEFKKWGVNFPFHVLNVDEYSGKEDFTVRMMVQNEPKSLFWSRLVKLFSWDKGNSILGISYKLFVKLTDERSGGDSSAKMRKILLEKLGLLVLDEGHIPRNDHSQIWKALGKVKTGQRIILSGTPFQNNLAELHNTLRLVQPEFTEKILSEILKLCQRRAELKSENEQNIFLERN